MTEEVRYVIFNKNKAYPSSLGQDAIQLALNIQAN